MRIDWSQEDVYGRARNPETRDEVLVGWNVIRDEMVYRINGGPFQTVARHVRALGLDTGMTALALLREHIAQCQATDKEELTLP